jgi:putative flippase GtrA
MANPPLLAGGGQADIGDGLAEDPRPVPAGSTAPPGSALIGQVARFGVAGLANVGVDLSVYSALLFWGAPIWVSKAIAFICGTAFAYWANKTWTFRAGRGNAKQFSAVAALYSVSMALNVGVNSLVIAMMDDGAFGRAVAYCCALVLSAAINFFGMREIFLRKQRDETLAG